MKRSLPAYVYLRKGKPYFERRGWTSQRIHSEPGTEDFAEEYARILKRTPVLTGAKTFKQLIASYRQSERYTLRSPRTKADYDLVLQFLEEKMGALPVEKMRRPDVIHARDANVKRRRFASYLVQVIRILMEHAIDLGWRLDNPAKDVALLAKMTPDRDPWPPALIEAFRQAAPPRARLVFELCVGTGQRIGDVLRMRWDDITDGGVTILQGKTKKRLWVPLTSILSDVLATTPRTGPTILVNDEGRPLKYRSAADDVMAVRKAIGATRYDIHSLRYTTAAELGALGCSDELIKAVTGHASAAMIAKYAGEARQKSRAKDAQARREHMEPES